MKKSVQIKIWPELSGYIPAVIPLPNIDKSNDNDLFLDFTNCEFITSSGLNIFLIKILKLLNLERKWGTNQQEDIKIIKIIKKLGFFNLLQCVINLL